MRHRNQWMESRPGLRDVTWISCALCLVSCTTSYPIEERDAGSPPDGAMLVDGGTDGSNLPEGKCRLASGLDLLVLVDNSNSMAEEQESLRDALPELIRLLTEPQDLDGDGHPDWLAVREVNVAVITTDMGTAGYPLPTCREPEFGDDARFVGPPPDAPPECADVPARMLTYRADGEMSPEQFARKVACLTMQGIGGCGFEQHLEAILKALTPSSSSIRFFRGTTGHGDGVNADFVRPDSMLGVLVLSDEEDCSWRDPDLVNPMSPTYAGNLNLRCFHYPHALHPVSRYVEGLRALRADRPDLFALAFVTGIPVDLSGDVMRREDADRILDDPRMAETIDPSMPSRLRPSCSEPGRGIAFPPRRMVELAGHFPGQATVHSICREDLTETARAIARLFGRRACLEYESR
ncbi:MAG: hypothetical protein RMK74_17100 [Myxococcales bacterium]|nr:hypothetical protein [Myxococcales bacterium]